MHFRRVLRWIAIAPAILAAWGVALVTGLGLLHLAMYYCPAEDIVSGMCTAWWYRYVEDLVFGFSTALAAALIVGVSALVAPSRRIVVTTVVLVGGIAYAIYLAIVTGLWLSFASATIAGLITWRLMNSSVRPLARL